MEPLITPTELRAHAYRVTIPTGQDVDAQLAALIDKAQLRMLHGACPGLAARIATDPDLAALATGVVEDMVLRVLRNPNGMREFSIDDFRRTVDAAMSTGAIYLSEDERAMLCGGSRRRSRKAFTMRVGLPTWRR